MERDYQKDAREYLEYEEHPFFRKEIEQLLSKHDVEELRERFYTQLAFGTGGIRGVVGAGYNRMNPYMVKRATQGLAQYVLKAGEAETPAVAIAHDSRHFSREFAESAAAVLAANGIKAYLFPSLRPTPELSFAVRELKATAGIVVTASHNPAQYNGYKVYWSDGAQIVPPHDEGIINEVHNVRGRIAALSADEARSRGLLFEIDANVDDAFIAMIKAYLRRPGLFQESRGKVKVVYTPLHGTGTMPMERVLGEMGVDVVTVPEQREPDGDFPTVKYPNPEEGAALKMAIDLATKEGADLVMGSDPDADRLGIAVREADGFRLITGNQLGSLLCDYMLATRRELGGLPVNPTVVKTIVTTELQRRIAESYGVKVHDVLTGFKYIGEKIREFEGTGEHYIFGGEESYGYLVETEVRDKDAISAAAVTVEMLLYDQSRNMTLIDHLNDLYRRFGYFHEVLVSKYFEGEEGLQAMNAMMERFRAEPPKTLSGQRVREFRDYRDGSVTGEAGRAEHALGLPSSNVVQFVLETGIVTVRPSGTEPKIKYYASFWADVTASLEAVRAEVEKQARSAERELQSLT